MDWSCCGMYWVYQDDSWYASSWYNNPWSVVDPEVVPLFILRVPVSYYRQPPVYFRSWQSNAPPRWGQHWGRGWEQRRYGWDRWNRGSAPAPAPLPVYQRQYSGDRYPSVEQQMLRSRNYRYQPRDPVIRQHYKQQHQGGGNVQQSAPTRQRGPAVHEQKQQPGLAQRVQQAPRPQGQEQRGQPQEQRNQGRGQERQNNEERGAANAIIDGVD